MARKKPAADEDRAEGSDGIRLTDHPRAVRSIRTVKSWGGLAGFAAGVLLAHRVGMQTGDALLRGILVGVAGYFVAWGTAVIVWRQLARAEIEHTRRMFVAAAERAEAEIERRRSDRMAEKARTA
ncbi:hypothetical protein [Paraconexibacter sp.]|uniref:hypothetical protein n=1 Tax=Paraconexibacter sp. TaxID=2949640 RepID=UPI0035626FFA